MSKGVLIFPRYIAPIPFCPRANNTSFPFSSFVQIRNLLKISSFSSIQLLPSKSYLDSSEKPSPVLGPKSSLPLLTLSLPFKSSARKPFPGARVDICSSEPLESISKLNFSFVKRGTLSLKLMTKGSILIASPALIFISFSE